MNKMRSASHMASTDDNTEDANTATHINKVVTTAAAGVTPPTNNPRNKNGMATIRGDDQCHTTGSTADRKALRTLGISDSKCVAPLASR